ncbi:MAG: hypothetical protein AAB815_00830 [Patescibacteria group bacterium]
MTEKLRQTIKEEIAKLPKEAQDIINAVNWVGITEKIAKKFNLTESEVTDFQVETLLVLTGLTNPELYSLNIENEVGVSKNEADKIADEVLEKIIIPMAKIKEDAIKKTLKEKDPHWQQNLGFIMSGGDYSAFVDTPKIERVEEVKNN